MVFTSTEDGADSDRHHNLFISFKNMLNMTIPFYDRGRDKTKNRGDMWIFNTSKYNLPCLNTDDVDQLAIVQSSNDNWHIHSVVTLLSMNGRNGTEYYDLLTVDMEANRWIGKSGGVNYERFNLTLHKLPHSQCPQKRPGDPGVLKGFKQG